MTSGIPGGVHVGNSTLEILHEEFVNQANDLIRTSIHHEYDFL